MKKSNLMKITAAGCSMALVLAMTGCAGNPLGAGQGSQDEAKNANRAYMTSVNQAIGSLNDRLDDFEEAVSRGDVVSMKTKAGKAAEVVADLEAIEAPEALKDVHADYVEGCQKLEEALQDYVALYTEVKGKKDESFNAKLKAVQSKYDEGIAKLKEGDEAAAGKGSEPKEEDSKKA